MEKVQRLQIALLARYLGAVRSTSTVSLVRPRGSGSALVTFWHDGILALLAATVGEKDVGIYIRDQPFIEDTLELLNLLKIRAFVSDHRGTASIKAARRWVGTPGRVLAVTADPIAPLSAVPGVAKIARMLGVPLCPLVVTASHGYRTERLDRCVVPHLAGRLVVQALPPVTALEVDAAASAVQRALPRRTLLEGTPPPSLPWRRLLEFCPRLCLLPRTRGQLTVWPNTTPIQITF